jgi:RNA polymerase sigma factor (sigma-70 family)
LTDEELIKGCQSNNRQAQNLLFTKYHRRVLGICVRYSSNIDEAKDIQQETFIKIFRELQAQKSAIGSLERWILRIAVNTSIDYFRKQRRLKSLNARLPYEAIATPTLDKLDEEELLAIIHSIPNPYRAVFNLFIVDGYNHREIGDLMEISESTSRSYLTRAKHLIKEVVTRREKKISNYG